LIGRWIEATVMKSMKRTLIGMVLLGLSATAPAAGTEYQMRVDGLACPYCAYGVEKKLKQIDGVEGIDIDLDKGVVTVQVREGVALTDTQMAKLFKDAGFTYRGMTATPP